MGRNADFNLQLNDTRRRFTYFVPRDWAWQQTQTEFPSTHKKLFMPDFYYHVSGNSAEFFLNKNICLYVHVHGAHAYFSKYRYICFSWLIHLALAKRL